MGQSLRRQPQRARGDHNSIPATVPLSYASCSTARFTGPHYRTFLIQGNSGSGIHSKRNGQLGTGRHESPVTQSIHLARSTPQSDRNMQTMAYRHDASPRQVPRQDRHVLHDPPGLQAAHHPQCPLQTMGVPQTPCAQTMGRRVALSMPFRMGSQEQVPQTQLTHKQHSLSTH